MADGLRRPASAAWLLAAPAVTVIVLVALFPLAWTFWESMHAHDLRAGQGGARLVGVGNYLEAFTDPRLHGALARTLAFTAVSVSLELVLGLALALALHGSFRGRGAARTIMLLPWAVPTVVAALVWRFMFEVDSPVTGWVSAVAGPGGGGAWFADPWLAWVPIVLADVWKTTPFVALLLLAGLQGIDPELLDAAAVDGADRVRRLWLVTLPLLRPAIVVALIFRTLDAMRVFDLVYVLTGGGPGTATEPLALYTFETLMNNLRFGYGSALSVLLFAVTFVLALAYVRLVAWPARGTAP